MYQTLEKCPSSEAAVTAYEKQSAKLSLNASPPPDGGMAVSAKFITPLDPVIQTADCGRLPVVPNEEARTINLLKRKVDQTPPGDDLRNRNDCGGDAMLQAAPPHHSRTHPLFPALPLYGPPTLLRRSQYVFFRILSFVGSTGFLLAVVLGAVISSVWYWETDAAARRRPFHELEKKRKLQRRETERAWVQSKRRRKSWSEDQEIALEEAAGYDATEGGPDPLVCDAAYYARRVGLDMEEFKVQTEDGFVITLLHVFDPREYAPASEQEEEHASASPAGVLEEGLQSEKCSGKNPWVGNQFPDGRKRYPVLLMHGLLQSAGAFCVNDDDSLAFFLHKSGYDVWLGNNRCGFNPEHTLLKASDPRMWAWNIRQMGVMDLPALVSKVIEATGFAKIGLVAHSQGTTEAFVALAKEQRPDLGKKLSVFCALAPAVYSGRLIDRLRLRIIRLLSPTVFRVVFGIHAFIPLMMTMHRIVPGYLYGAIGYRVFAFLFDWSDSRWERDLRDRFFQFAPVYVSAESMRWWLGRDCFAKQRCILATREDSRKEEAEDEDEEEQEEDRQEEEREKEEKREYEDFQRESRYRRAWYNEQVCPMALWIGGSDELVDGRRLLRRFQRGREPCVQLIHAKVIEEYEHLDVLWAVDSVEQVGKEVRAVLWQTMSQGARQVCRRPTGELQSPGSREEGTVQPA